MIDLATLTEIIATYQKHGWILRRVLLSGSTKQALGPLFTDVQVCDSTIDAAWFSRPPASGGVAWEIRYLGDVPFALLENIDEQSPSFEYDLNAAEARLNDALTARKSA